MILVVSGLCYLRFVQDDILKVTRVEFLLNEAVVLDYYVSALWWAGKEQKFSKEEISAFYTVIHTLLQYIQGRFRGHVVASQSRACVGAIFTARRYA